jgi:tetratricopeptide (TPR) repeat protein
MKKTGFIQLIFLFYLCSNLFAQTINKFQLEIEKAKNSNDTVALAKAWYNLGKEYDNLQQTENCNKALHQAIYWSELNKNFSTFSSAANYLAANYSYSGNSDSAFIYYKKAIEACILNSDSLKMASILINLGDEYASTGNYLEAANHAIMALRIKETLKDSANLAYFYQKLGEVYKMADENDKWEEYIQKGYRLIKNEKYTNKRTIASIYNDLGGIAEKHGDYDMALNYYDTLISIGKEIEYFNAVGVALSNSATIHKLQGNHEKALDAALQAQKYKTNTSYQQVYDNNLLAELYLETGNSRKALEFAKKAITNENIGNIPDERMRALKIHYQIEKYNRNFEKALLWLEKYKQLSDSIRDKEIRTKIVDLELE